MAYYPNYYPYQQAYLPAQQPAQQNREYGLAWVQGEAAAKSYLVAPNVTMYLMDAESKRFYIKTADGSGVPLPLRVFEYKELTGQSEPAPYVTREEFEKFKEALKHDAE